MNELRCPRCQASLAGDAPLGLCPACLLQQGFESAADVRPSGERTATSPGERFVPPAPAELAARFPQLEIQELLGHGGMGAVYRARQRSLDRLVALKILPPKISNDPAFAERFQREARTLARLSHPNIVVIYEFGKADGYYYLLMEYVDGVNLRQAIQAKTLGPAAALGVVPQICDALQYAHEEGVVHRDIKPENLLLDKRGRVKIADFGLAKLLGRTPLELTLTASHQIMGTLHYMAPEQFDRPLTVDHRADIYSLGVVFYELLTGELPLGRYPLPSETAHVDVRLDQVVLKTLERKPEARYQHASEVKTDVESISFTDRPAPAAPRRASQPGGAAAMQAERNLKNAATGMMVLGAMNVLLPVAVHIWLFLAAAVGFIHHADVDDFWYLFFSVPSGILMLLGGWGMHRMQSYPLAMVGIVAATIPCGPLWLATMPVAVLSLLALRQPGIPERFAGSWDVLGLLAPAGAMFGDGAAAERVRAPGITLLVLGALNILIPLVVNVAVFMDRPDDDYFVLFFSIPAGVVMALGGWGMLQIRWYGLAVAGAVAAMIPCGPVWIISLPVGIWAMIVLRSDVVKAAFGVRAAEHRRVLPAVDVASIRRQMRGPGTALAATAIVGMGLLVAATLIGLYSAFFSREWRHHEEVVIVPLTLLGLSVPFAGLMIIGGWKMRNLELYWLSLIAAIAAVLPLHPLVIVTLPVGVWAISLLAQREVRAAFGQAGSFGLRDDLEVSMTPPLKPDQTNDDVRHKLTLPAVGLMVAGVVDGLIAAAMVPAVLDPGHFGLNEEVVYAIAASSLVMGAAFVISGLNMLRFRAYHASLTATILAIAPLSPAWPISIACGINLLSLLASREMRREFDLERRRTAEFV